jgi:hypothetical protein
MTAFYVCPLCGKRGVVDPSFTQMDARYATGRCPDHVSIRELVREDFTHTERKKKNHGPYVKG